MSGETLPKNGVEPIAVDRSEPRCSKVFIEKKNIVTDEIRTELIFTGNFTTLFFH